MQTKLDYLTNQNLKTLLKSGKTPRVLELTHSWEREIDLINFQSLIKKYRVHKISIEIWKPLLH